MEDNQRKLIKRLNELYLIQRGHYLIQYNNGGYGQFTKGQKQKNGKKALGLTDWHIAKHFEGEFTIGTFGGPLKNSKFMTFDIDFHKPEMAKWITYKIINILNQLGINKHYISVSGLKGYHIDIFFDDLIKIAQAEEFFNYVVNKSCVAEHFDESNKVEFRVTQTMGIKLPLGIHQKTGVYCGYCMVEDGLRVMSRAESESYFFTIEKIKYQKILDILESDAVCPELINIDKKTLEKTEDAISPHTPLENYEQSEDISIDKAQDLFINGLKAKGTRNNSLFLIGLYLKYQGYEEEQCKNELYKWMDWQDEKLYSTPVKDCYREIDNTVKNMYLKNYDLRPNIKDLTVSYEEIKWIIDNCPEKNQKLITYAMLIHSKRHANKKGVFYMPYNMIESTTGLSERTAIRQINKLVELEIIEIVARNRKVEGKHHLPNLYRINFTENKDGVTEEELNKFDIDEFSSFKCCIEFYFTHQQLKEILPKRQYDSLVNI